jgi:hypothetical protein
MILRGHLVVSWLKRYVTSRKDIDSGPNEVADYLSNPSNQVMVPVCPASNRIEYYKNFLGVKRKRLVRIIN